jgi:hypothetical protein
VLLQKAVAQIQKEFPEAQSMNMDFTLLEKSSIILQLRASVWIWHRSSLLENLLMPLTASISRCIT